MLTTHLPIYLASSKSLLWRMSHCVVITCLLFMFTVCVSVYCPAVPWPGAGLRAAASRLLWLCAGWRLFVRLSGPAEPDRSEAAGSGWGSSGPGARDIGPGQGGESSFRGDQSQWPEMRLRLCQGSGQDWGGGQDIRYSDQWERDGARIKLYLARGQYYTDRISIKAR